MRIAFDAGILNEKTKTGVGYCAKNVMLHLPLLEENEYILNIVDKRIKEKTSVTYQECLKRGYQECKLHWILNSLSWRISRFIPISYSSLFRNQADITIFFNFLVPYGVKGKTVTVVHDMTYKAFPETVHQVTKRNLEKHLKTSCDRADKIVTVSEFSKQEIRNYLNIPEDKIIVMPNGIDENLYHVNYTKEQCLKVLKKYKIEQPYLLYLGTLEPRKNIERLIRAYGMIKDRKTDIPKLVIAGKKGWMFEAIFQTVHDLKLENEIIFTDYVEEKEVPLLMKAAELFIFPSLYEGFGLPPLEAMACGTAVISSNTSSLPEVIGDAGILIDPFKEEEIAQAIEELLTNEQLRIQLEEKGKKRAACYSWENSTKVLEKLIHCLK